MDKSVLLFGGRSDERLVSVASGQNLSKRFNFDELWFIGDDGAIYSVTKEELAKHERPFEVPFKPGRAAIAKSIEAALPQLQDRTVYIGLHGTEGEDGTLQAMFERKGIPFTGSGAQSSRDCFDKVRAKEIVKNEGIPLAPQIILTKYDQTGSFGELTAFFKANGAMVLKPIANGSSFGLRIIKEEAQIQEASEMIAKAGYGKFMIERFIQGRELTCGVMDSPKGIQALPPSEVRLETGRSFDYAGKYLGSGTIEVTPADLNPAELEAAQALAVSSHRALKCYGYTRTDMILTDRGVVFLETNTLPGMSKASFIPQQLEAMGYPIAQFIEEQLQLARARYK